MKLKSGEVQTRDDLLSCRNDRADDRSDPKDVMIFKNDVTVVASPPNNRRSPTTRRVHGASINWNQNNVRKEHSKSDRDWSLKSIINPLNATHITLKTVSKIFFIEYESLIYHTINCGPHRGIFVWTFLNLGPPYGQESTFSGVSNKNPLSKNRHF